MQLIEAAAEGEDSLLEKYLEGEELSPEEILRGFKKVVLAGNWIPVFVAAGSAEIGLATLLDAIDQPDAISAGGSIRQLLKVKMAKKS